MKLKLGVLLLVLLTVGCVNNQSANTVVVYTSVDQNFSAPAFAKFTEDTGLEVKAVYDVEAAKTTGLVNRLIAEKNKPIADVFWNGEIAQMIALQQQGVLTEYSSLSASDIPATYQGDMWTAFGGRARCFIINTNMLKPENYPSSINDFINGRYSTNQIAIARPLFGTTATQAAALYAAWGQERAHDFYQQIAQGDVQIVDGNSVVRDMVVAGQLIFGLTDTDDALGAIEKGAPVTVVFPDQGENQIGTLIIPNTVALINQAPNQDNGKAFIDWLLKTEQEEYLMESGWCQVAVRPVSVTTTLPIDDLKGMDIDYAEVYDNLEQALDDLRELFMQ